MAMRRIAVCLAFIVGSLSATAQMTSGGPAPAVGTVVAPSKAIESELAIIEGEMMSAVKAMPADRFGFAPSAAIFAPAQKTEFATVRTFAQQATHVAQANYSMYMDLSGLKADADVAGMSKLTKKEDVVAALAGSFAFAHRAIATLTAANAFEVVKLEEGGVQTRATAAQFAISHANDHYGQMVEYLRMNGIVPPASAR